MKYREFGTLISVGQITEATGISASIIFRAAASESINLAVPIKRGTAFTLIEQFVDNELVAIDERLVYPVHHPQVSALLLTTEACSDLADCNIAVSRFFKGGLMLRSGKCVKTLIATKRRFIPGRSELEVAVKEKKDTRFLPEILNPDVIEMIRDGGAYCSTTSSRTLTELTGVLHFDSYTPINRVFWPLSDIGTRRIFRHIQCYRYKFGVYPEVLPSALVSKKRGIEAPRELRLEPDNLLLPTSDLEAILEYTKSELVAEEIKKLIRSVRSEPTEAVIAKPQPPSLLIDPEFPESQRMAKRWVDEVCRVEVRGRRPVDAVYRVAAVAVHWWIKLIRKKVPGRGFGEYLQSWLEESEIAKDDAKKLASLIRNQRGLKALKQVEVRAEDEEPWKKSNFQHFLFKLRDGTESLGGGKTRDSLERLIPDSEDFIDALCKKSSVKESIAEASVRLVRNERIIGLLLKDDKHE